MKNQDKVSSNKTIENGSNVLKLDQTVLLQKSIVSYLQRCGFSKTLKKFCSEANVKNEGLEHVSLNLEEMCSKYIESCNGGGTTFKSLEQGMPVLSGSTDVKEKQNRSESNAVVFPVRPCDKVSKTKGLTENSTNSLVTESVLKSKGKKKMENNSVSLDHGREQGCTAKSTEEASTDDVFPELEVKSKGKKKKKHSDSIVHACEQVTVEVANATVDGTDKVSIAKNPMTMSKDDLPVLEKKPKEKKKIKHASDSACDDNEDISAKAIKVSKEKKKNKDKPVSVVHDYGAEQESFEKVQEDKKEKKDKKKRKWSASDDIDNQPFDEVVPEKSKRQKTEGQEEETKRKELKEANGLLDGVDVSGKEMKTDKNQVQDISEKNGEEKSDAKKSTKTQSKRSVEPMALNAFKRIKIDQVTYADERLQDNSYWAKDGAENGYGAKAQEILGQVRGRNFRHEKTKKKRGTYRGGQIDMESHSVKFNYSDED